MDTSSELLRLLWKVELRLEYHRQKALGFAAVAGQIRDELLRPEATFGPN
jgi:hypothetical protein